MLRRCLVILLGISTLISLASLIFWPLSFYVTLSMWHINAKMVYRLNFAGGQLMQVYQGGGGTIDYLASLTNAQKPAWGFTAVRNSTRYFDSHEYWKDSMSFSHWEKNYPYRRGGRVIVQRLVGVPLWLLAWLFAMPPAIAFVPWHRRRYRLINGLCLRCGYDLSVQRRSVP